MQKIFRNILPYSAKPSVDAPLADDLLVDVPLADAPLADDLLVDVPWVADLWVADPWGDHAVQFIMNNQNPSTISGIV